MTSNLEQLKREFLEHVEIEKGNSHKTVNNYNHYIARFFLFAKITEPKEITDDKIREFRLYLNRQPGVKIRGQQASTLKKNTQNYHLIALRSFLKYLMKYLKAMERFTLSLSYLQRNELVLRAQGLLRRRLRNQMAQGCEPLAPGQHNQR